MRPSKFYIILIISILSLSSFAQKVQKEGIEINWLQPIQFFDSRSQEELTLYNFQNANFDLSESKLPQFSKNINLNFGYPKEFEVEIIEAEWELLPESRKLNQSEKSAIAASLNIKTEILMERKKTVARISFYPFRINRSGQAERLIKGVVTIQGTGVTNASVKSNNYVEHSKLAAGEWYKINITEDGIYKLTYQHLQQLGVNPEGMSSDQINVYGNGGEMLPFLNSDFRYDDLQLNAIKIVDGNDGIFNPSDYLLFYAKGPDKWEYDPLQNEFVHTKHLFVESTSYFIGINIDPPKRIESIQTETDNADQVVNTFNAFSYHENDWVNLIKSGREFYGEKFDVINEYILAGQAFNFSNIDISSPVKVVTNAISRAVSSGTGNFTTTTDGNSNTLIITSVNSSAESQYAKPGEESMTFIPTSDNLTTQISYTSSNPGAIGWLNFVRINARRNLKMVGTQMIFRDIESVGDGLISEFVIGNSQLINEVWDITNLLNVKSVPFEEFNNEVHFKLKTDSLRTFISFNGTGYKTPTLEGEIANQDIHGWDQPDMVIVSPLFINEEAEELADLHRSDGLTVEVISPEEIYNEFSSGNPDVTAIKQMMKMLYDRAGNIESLLPRYLLIFGDGSYDNKSNFSGNTNFVITYQSEDSNHPTRSYCSDDYFGLLDDFEGEGTNESVDIGIGRITVKDKQEAKDVVEKIKRYIAENTNDDLGHCSGIESASPFGDWRNRILFVADDEDSNLHISQCNQLASIVEQNHPEFDVQKIYIDAYLQESTPGGERFPQASGDLHQSLNRGNLINTYVGHGGEVGWAAERILDLPTIQSLNNSNALSVFLTATCEFSRYDDYERTSAGEFLLLNPSGGAIALLSTTRLVYSSPNYTLSSNFFEQALEEDQNPELRLGDITRITKNNTPGSSSSTNKRNFSLLGDPALRISYPKYRVVTNSIEDDNEVSIDTLNALSKVTVKGKIVDQNGQLLESFNGVVRPIIFDKKSNISTLANNGGSSYNFQVRKNILFRGNAQVTNGLFEFSFIVPKDINYQFGQGRISYYGADNSIDAHGYFEDFIIGGESTGLVSDADGPTIEVFMNDEHFVNGGITDDSPLFLAKIFDENGINTAGNGIGHDLTLTIDGDGSNSEVLNDYYESDLNTYKSGTIKFQLPDLENGNHTLTFKAWDVYNNSNEKELEFVITDAGSFRLDHVLNYPNPFSTNTSFFFEHNKHCAFLNVQIQVFTVSGKLVKTIDTVVDNDGFRSQPINWDGRDDFGDKIGRGVYVYRLKVTAPGGEKEEKFEKLVILN